MDKSAAVISSNKLKYIFLHHFKDMSKKFVFSVVVNQGYF